MLELLSRGTLKTRLLITHRFPLDEISHAFDVAMDKEKTGEIFVALSI